MWYSDQLPGDSFVRVKTGTAVCKDIVYVTSITHKCKSQCTVAVYICVCTPAVYLL